MRKSKPGREAFIDWITSDLGTRPRPYLRPFRLPISTRLWLLWSKRRIVNKIHMFCPPFAKVIALKRYARQYGLGVFIETGTYLGATTACMADVMANCFTIELSESLWERSCERFADRPNVSCLHGDSAQVLPQIMKRLDRPALFWLDAHASGGLSADAGYDPIQRELSVIFERPISRASVILIDDARGHDIDRIRACVPVGHAMSVRNDIIRIVPREPVEIAS